MKVEDNGILVNLGTYRNSIKERTKTDNSKINLINTVVRNDRVKLSEQAKRIQNINNLLQSTPDIRENKVLLLKNRIESGTYKIDEQKIAKKMLNDAILNSHLINIE